MSKKYYVLYSLKEFIIPKVFKTKATLNKHLEKNSNCIFKQFYDQEQAYQFSKQIEKQLEHKFHIKVQERLQTSFIDLRLQSFLNVEKERQEQHAKKMSNQESQRIIDEIVIEKRVQKQSQANKDQKQQKEVILAVEESVMNEIREQIKDIKEEIKLEQMDKLYKPPARDADQQIQNKQSNLSVQVQERSQQPTKQQQFQALSSQQSVQAQHKNKSTKQTETELVHQKSKLKLEDQQLEDIINYQQSLSNQTSVLNLTKSKNQPIIIEKEIKQLLKSSFFQANNNNSEANQIIQNKPKIQQKNSRNLQKTQMLKQQHNQQTQLQKQFALLNQTLLALPQVSLFMHQLSQKQNQTSFLHNHPLHKDYVNLPYLNIQSKILHHFSKYTHLLLQENDQLTPYDQPSTLKIYLSQKQNPGLAVAKYILITSRGQFKKMQMLGVKGRSQSQMITLWKGLQMAKFYGQKNLKIETAFNLKSIDKYKNSIDKRIRDQAQNYLSLEQQFKKIEYL